MIYHYLSSGTIKTGGCAKTGKKLYLTHKFSENSIVYLKFKAKKGVLERIAIKKVILRAGPKSYNTVVPLYQDTLNSLYNEEDLISELEARTIAVEYWENVLLQVRENKCKINQWPRRNRDQFP